MHWKCKCSCTIGPLPTASPARSRSAPKPGGAGRRWSLEGLKLVLLLLQFCNICLQTKEELNCSSASLTSKPWICSRRDLNPSRGGKLRRKGFSLYLLLHDASWDRLEVTSGDSLRLDFNISCSVFFSLLQNFF